MTPLPTAPWWALYGIAAMVVVIFAALAAASCFLADTTLRTTMFTGALTLASLVAGYFFGSSKSGGDKDATIAAIATGPSQPQGQKP